MNKQLPIVSNNKKGFTLIELLVVIAIIAILATIGAAIFSGVQQRARDGRRTADTSAIAKALEANKTTTTTVYKSLLATWFAGGAVPADPGTASSYCIGWNATSGTAVAKPTTWTGLCPTVGEWGATATEVDTAAIGQPCAGASACSPAGNDTTVVNFQVCAKSEVTPSVFICTPNQQ